MNTDNSKVTIKKVVDGVDAKINEVVNTNNVKEVKEEKNIDNQVIIPLPSAPKAIDVSIPKMERFTFNYNVHWTQKEESSVKIERVGRPGDDDFVIWKNIPQIGMFNDLKSFLEAKYKLALFLLSKCVEIAQQDEEIDPTMSYWHRTKDSQLGLVPKDIVSLLRNPSRFIDSCNNVKYASQSSDTKVQKGYFSFTDMHSRTLALYGRTRFALEKVINDTPANIQKVVSFFKENLSSDAYYLKDLPDDYVEKFGAFYLPAVNFDSFNRLRRKSMVIRNYCVNVVKDFVQKRVLQSAIDYENLFTELMATLSLQTNTSSALNTLPNKFSKVNKSDVMRKLILLGACSADVCASYTVRNNEDFDHSCLLDCLMFFLFVPSYAAKNQNIVDMANYLYFNIYQMVAKAKSRDSMGYTVNMFTNPANSDVADGDCVIVFNALRDYCARFSDWSAVPNITSKQFVNHGPFFTGRTHKMNYMYPVGIDRGSLSKKLDQFNVLLQALTGIVWKKSKVRQMNALLELMNKVHVNFEHICVMKKTMNSICDVCSSSAHSSVISYNDYLGESLLLYRNFTYVPRENIVFEPSELGGIGLAPVVNESLIPPLVIDDVMDGMYMAGYVNEVNERYGYAEFFLNTARETSFHLSEKLFKKKDKIEFAFNDLAKRYFASKSFSSGLLSEFLTRWDAGFQLVSVPSTNMDFALLSTLYGAIETNHISHGYSRNVVIAPSNETMVIGNVRFIIPKYTQADYGREYTHKELVQGGSTFAAEMRKYVKDRKIVNFAMPFKVRFERYFDNPKAKNVLPVTVYKDSTVVETREITVYYDIVPEYKYVTFRTPELIEEPLVFPSEIAFDINEQDTDITTYAIGNMGMMDRPNNNVKFFTANQLFRTVFYSQ